MNSVRPALHLGAPDVVIYRANVVVDIVILNPIRIFGLKLESSFLHIGDSPLNPVEQAFPVSRIGSNDPVPVYMPYLTPKSKPAADPVPSF
jgi:hypothetical protein